MALDNEQLINERTVGGKTSKIIDCLGIDTDYIPMSITGFYENSTFPLSPDLSISQPDVTPVMSAPVAVLPTKPTPSNLGLFTAKDFIGFIKPTNSPATIMIMESNASEILYKTNKFILQNISKPKMERFQIVETFGESHLFFFDERTKVYTFAGVMLDAFYVAQDSDLRTVKTTDDINKLKTTLEDKYQWAQGFEDFYDNFLRGTRLAKNGHIAAIYVDDLLIKGYPIQLVINKESATLPDAVQFQMTWAVKDEILLRSYGARNTYDPDGGEKLKSTDAWNEYFGLVNTYKSALLKYQNAKRATNTKIDTLKKLYKDLSETVDSLRKVEATLKQDKKAYVKTKWD